MATKYAILSAGNHNFTDHNTWSTTADGLGTPTDEPTSTVDVVPSAIIENGATLTIDTAAQSCLSIDMSSVVAYGVTLAGTQSLTISGSCNMTGIVRTFTGILVIRPGNGVTANVTLPQVWANTIRLGSSAATTGIIDLLTDIDNGSTALAFYYGTINTNNHTITCGAISELNAQARTYNFGSSVINCTSWTMTATNLTLGANTATINISGTGALAGGAVDYNGATFCLKGTAHTVSGAMTGKAITFKPIGKQIITWTDATTYTFTNAYNTGGLITWKGSGAAGYTVNITGANILENISVSRCTATTPLIFTGHPVDGGNNVGITFRRRKAWLARGI